MFTVEGSLASRLGPREVTTGIGVGDSSKGTGVAVETSRMGAVGVAKAEFGELLTGG